MNSADKPSTPPHPDRNPGPTGAAQVNGRGRGRPPAIQPTEVHHDLTVVDGEAGRRLAALQAQVILDVLTWFREHATADTNEPDPAK